jgi:hypothetical protein
VASLDASQPSEAEPVRPTLLSISKRLEIQVGELPRQHPLDRVSLAERSS